MKVDQSELLNLKTVGDLRKGAFGLQVDTLIDQAMRDCDDRPSIDKARVVTIEIELIPEPNDAARQMSAVAVSTSAKLKLPPMMKLGSILEVHREENENGQLVVHGVMPYETQDAPGQKNMFKNDREDN
jgi:hypothetical protein